MANAKIDAMNGVTRLFMSHVTQISFWLNGFTISNLDQNSARLPMNRINTSSGMLRINAT